MHFEILIEDQSGKKTLDILMPKIIGRKHTYRVISYRGIGRIPKNLKSRTEARNRILLDRLPELLKGYGNTYASNPAKCSTVLIVVRTYAVLTVGHAVRWKLSQKQTRPSDTNWKVCATKEQTA